MTGSLKKLLITRLVCIGLIFLFTYMEVRCKAREKIVAILFQKHFSINYDYFLKKSRSVAYSVVSQKALLNYVLSAT